MRGAAGAARDTARCTGSARPSRNATTLPTGCRVSARSVATCGWLASRAAAGPPSETCSVEIGQGAPSASRKATVVTADLDTDSVGTASSAASDRSTTRTPAADSGAAAAACASAAAVASAASAVRGRAGPRPPKFHPG